jgi:hypothetical protein
MSNCKDCVHSVFDEVWGEYKCKVHEHRIYNLVKQADCGFYKKDPNKKGEK